MNRIVKRIISLIKHNSLSSIRKMKDDWNLETVGRRTWYSIGIALLLVYLCLLTLVVMLGTRFIELPLNTWSQFILIAIFLEQLLWTMDFFKKNKKIFLLDTRKFIHQLEEVRFLQLFSAFVLKSVIKSICVWYLFVFPVFIILFAIQQTTVHPLFIFLIGFIYFTFTCLFAMLFSYIPYIMNHVWRQLSHSKIISSVLFVISLTVPLLMGYGVYYVLSDGNMVQNIKYFLASPLFKQIFTCTPYVWIANHEHDMLTAFLSFTVGIFVIMILFYIWSATLKRLDLIPYTGISDVTRAPKIRLNDQSKIFRAIFQKDILFLLRIHGFFARNFGNMLYALMVFLGFGIPFIQNQFSTYPEIAIVSFSVLIAHFTYLLVGDALKMVLSVDGELKNQHLFQPNIKNAWQMVMPKISIYNLIVLLFSVFMSVLLAFLFKCSVPLIICLFVMFATSGFLYGLVYISSTALYPKKNWEHDYEIGESGKAQTFTHLYSGFIFIVSLQITGVTAYMMYTKSEIQTTVLNTASAGFILFTLLNYVIMFFYLKKINLFERIANHD